MKRLTGVLVICSVILPEVAYASTSAIALTPLQRVLEILTSDLMTGAIPSLLFLLGVFFLIASTFFGKLQEFFFGAIGMVVAAVLLFNAKAIAIGLGCYSAVL